MEQDIISTVNLRRCYTKQDSPLEYCDTFPAFSEIEQSVNLFFDFSFQRQLCEKKKTSIPFLRQFSYMHFYYSKMERLVQSEWNNLFLY